MESMDIAIPEREFLFNQVRPESLESAVRQIMSNPDSDVFLFQDPAIPTFKYGELDVLREFLTYVSDIYHGHHYVGKNGIQVNDLLISNGLAPDFWRGNVIKYVARYGQKTGNNRIDLIKAMHYLVLLMGHESSKGEI